MNISFGYFAVHARPLHRSAEAAERLATLLTDRRWPWQPSVVRPQQLPGRPVYPWPSGKVARAKLRETVIDIVRSDNTIGITLVASRQDAGNHAWIDVRSGHADYEGNIGARFPFDVRILCRAYGLPAGKRIEDWVELMHELTTLIEPGNAVILANANEMPLTALLYGGGAARADMAIDSPRYEVVRVNLSRKELGSRYVRPPAWGTYLAPAHVEAVGGRERIVEVVRPPVMRDVGSMLYVQLTERVEDAVSPEALERRRLFAELLEPITVPREPVEEAIERERRG